MKRAAIALLTLTIAAQSYALQAARQQPSNPPAPVVNVNTATEAQYALLPGIGPKLAAILSTHVETCCDHQEGARAAFKSINDLLNVKGISTGRLAKMRPYIVLTGATTATVKIRVAKVVKP